MINTLIPNRPKASPLTNISHLARSFFINATVLIDPRRLQDYIPLAETDDDVLETILTELSFHLHTEKPWEPITVLLERRDNRHRVEVTFTVGYESWENGQRVTLRWADEAPC